MKKILNSFLAAAVSVGSISCGYPEVSADVAAAPESLQQRLGSANETQKPPDAGDPDALKLRKYSLACSLQYYNALGGPLNFTSTPPVIKPYGEYDQIVIQDGKFNGRVAPVYFRGQEPEYKKALRAVSGRLIYEPGGGQPQVFFYSLNQLHPAEAPVIDTLDVGGFLAPFEREGKILSAAQFSCDLVETHREDGTEDSARTVGLEQRVAEALHAKGLERAEEMKRQFEAQSL